MSNQRDLDLAEQALRQLRSTAVPVEDADRVEQRRPRLVAVLEREIEAVPKVRVARERRTRVVSAMLAAAAVVVLAWGTVRLTDDRTGSAAAVNAPAPGAQVRSWSGDVSLGPPGHHFIYFLLFFERCWQTGIQGKISYQRKRCAAI